MSDINPQVTLGDFSTDPTRPDYACPAYMSMLPTWQVVEDVREGTEPMRAKKVDYLPKFEAEEPPDWNARVLMTFASDTYELTLEEHVGLVMAEGFKLGDDVPKVIRDEIVPDFNGEGDSLDVFATDVLDSAMHFGHAILWTDYPDTGVFKNLAEKRAAGVRAFSVLYRAPDVLNWSVMNVAGKKVITEIVFREYTDRVVDGKPVVRYRRVWQDVSVDEETKRAFGLGTIHWETTEKVVRDGSDHFAPAGNGVIIGPDRIPARVIYGGRKISILQSRPHLKGIAYTSLEEIGVQSDYAHVMHKCNVPTPIFIGRVAEKGQPVRMGQGIDLPIDGDAKMLEPKGTAIKATERRLANLSLRMQRQGATTSDGSGKTLTATEAGMIAKSRQAKLAKAAESNRDAFVGSLSDMAAFMNIGEGGSIEIDTEFAGVTIDPVYLGVLTEAFRLGAVPLDSYLFALEKGRLPDDFSSTETALRLLAEAEANREIPGEEEEEEEFGGEE